MSASANIKSKFANLKYDQLLTEKYFINTCFTKHTDVVKKREEARDMYMHITTHSECREGIRETTTTDYCESTS